MTKKIRTTILLSLFAAITIFSGTKVSANSIKINTYQINYNQPTKNGTIVLNNKPLIADEVKIKKSKYLQLKGFGINNNWIKAKDLKLLK